jgi:hypothetical protein
MTDLHYSITYLSPFQYEDESAYIGIDHPLTRLQAVGQVGPKTKEQFAEFIAHHDYPLLTFHLFQQPGVVALDVRYDQVWVMKSPVFMWFDVMTSLLGVLGQGFGSLIELPGSADVFGSGKRLTVAQQKTMGIKRT